MNEPTQEEQRLHDLLVMAQRGREEEEGTDCSNCSNVVYDGNEMCNECRFVSKEDLQEWFDDSLDENNPEITIGTLTYDPSHVLRSVDPVAYRIGMGDYADYLAEEGKLVEGYNDN